jgi:hypothetical protein
VWQRGQGLGVSMGLLQAEHVGDAGARDEDGSAGWSGTERSGERGLSWGSENVSASVMFCVGFYCSAGPVNCTYVNLMVLCPQLLVILMPSSGGLDPPCWCWADVCVCVVCSQKLVKAILED